MKKDSRKRIMFSVRNKKIYGIPKLCSDGIHMVLALETASNWKDYPTDIFQREFIMAMRIETNIYHVIMGEPKVRIIYTL